jgi:hypothetical protein
MRLCALCLICTLVFAGAAGSTTVIPPTFDALVSGASTVFVGEVMDQRAYWVNTSRGRAIRTQVVFRVEDVWKGSAGVVTQLDFLGGTIGETTMEVVGMPAFRTGQRNVLFVAAQRGVSPLVGFMHGRMRVERDFYGVDRVRTNEGRSLGGISQVGPQRPGLMMAITPMRLSELAAAVKALAQRSQGLGVRMR